MAGLIWLAGKASAASARAPAPNTQAKSYSGTDPNAACAGCHRAIYERYRKTPMANGSGPADEGFLPGNVTNSSSGVSYRLSEKAGRVWLDFSREAGVLVTGERVAGAPAGEAETTALRGRRELRYFLGSAKRGRTYLFEDQGYWFEIPINWYAKKQVWDMAPRYLNAREMPLTLPVDPGCLHCHTSGAQPSLPEARNKYADVPFRDGGVTCAACHGDVAAHVASGGKVAMMQIGALAPEKRDSICLNCHLEGQVAVVKAGKRLVDFRPGESVFEYASYFVLGGAPAGVAKASAVSSGRATSQWEALLQSACKRGAGEKLTCTTCHDPHGSDEALTAEERVAVYRAKCLQCHGVDGTAVASGAGFVAGHHAEVQDCASCHMPRAKSSDIAHEQVTDHRIVRHAAESVVARETTLSSTLPLVLVGAERVGEAAGDRDLGMGYAQMAALGNRAAAQRALELLREAEKLPEAATDHQMHGQLGFLEQLAGDKDGAAKEYEAALAADPDDSFAAGNLALLKAQAREYGVAIQLWSRAFEEDPVQLKAGMNLAIVECGVGQREAALGTLARLLEFSPDMGEARKMDRAIRSGAEACAVRREGRR